jgi:Holliday junction resolvase RusA-like endonuclease
LVLVAAVSVTLLAFVVPGMPVGKGRAKIVKIGGFSRMATPKKTAAYEGLVAHAAQAAMGAFTAPFEGALGCELDIDCPVPESWSQKKRRMALAGEIFPTTKPDKDNVIKAIYDGCNGVVWRDDVQVVDGVQRKRYSLTPRVRVRVYAVAPMPVQESIIAGQEAALSF